MNERQNGPTAKRSGVYNIRHCNCCVIHFLNPR